ncbi:adenosylcobinamide-GDP ribazoletransferase, partial [Streptomyces sp. NPDC055058]
TVTAAAAAAGGLLLGPAGLVRAVTAVALSVAAAGLLLRHCVRRFGGVTGDVFGGLAETAATTALVVASLG